MTDHAPSHDAPSDSPATYEEFELDDKRLVVYDTNNPDAWLASDARLAIQP
jgi:hypothetical protein